jgi:DNA-binding NtrC family response regulator
VRELRNVLERAVVLCNGEEIGEADLPRDLRSGEANAAVDDIGAGKVLTIRDAEKIAIERALTHTGWKKGLTAELLGVSWPTLNKKIAEYGIEKPGT